MSASSPSPTALPAPRPPPRPWGRAAVGLLLLALAWVAELALGAHWIPPGEVLHILAVGVPAKLLVCLGHLPLLSAWQDTGAAWLVSLSPDALHPAPNVTIVLELRLPRALTAALAGAALAVSGLQMQTLFRNPLAGPDVLGISSGASLGVALVVLGGGLGHGSVGLVAGLGWLGRYGLVVGATLGAAAVLLLVLLVARRVANAMTLLILGLLLGYTTSALTSLLFNWAIAENLQAYINWSFGSFGGVSWSSLAAFAPAVLLGLGLAALLMKPLNALLLGETYARTLGLHVRGARVGILASTALLTGAVTAYCGPIGFIGIAVPHLCRSLFATANHVVLLPAVALAGALCALLADVVSQAPGLAVSLPLNAITALIGAPVVAWVILSRRNLRESFAG